MKFRAALVLGLVFLFGAMTSAQDYSKIEVTANYSYIHANPQNNNIIPAFSLNGAAVQPLFISADTSESKLSFRATAASRTT